MGRCWIMLSDGDRFESVTQGIILLIWALPAFAGIQAGVARVDITPKEAIWLAGYASRTHRSVAVRQAIYTKAGALRDDHGSTVVQVTSDLLGFRGHLRRDCGTGAKAVRRIAGSPGVQRFANAFRPRAGERAVNTTYPLEPEDAKRSSIATRSACRIRWSK